MNEIHNNSVTGPTDEVSVKVIYVSVSVHQLYTICMQTSFRPRGGSGPGNPVEAVGDIVYWFSNNVKTLLGHV